MKHILVAVAGNSPAIITETLWALKNKPEGPVTIDEVRILTTAEGQRIIQEQLRGTGIWDACCLECGYDEPLTLHIETLRDGSGDLDDIRTSDENILAADQIYGFIRQWTNEEKTTLHCSIAGGRKVMSAYLSNALMLCARREDKAYHVLVSPAEFEKYQGFYYPHEGVVTLYDARDMPHHRNAQTAQIELAEIYFVKLRELLSDSMLEGLTTYQEIVERVQTYLLMLSGNAALIVGQIENDDPYAQIPITIADITFKLSPSEGMLYALLVLLRHERREILGQVENITSDDWRKVFQLVTGKEFGARETHEFDSNFDNVRYWIQCADRIRKGEPSAVEDLKKSIQPIRTRANESLAWAAEIFKIAPKTYTVAVSPDNIHWPR